MLTILAIIRLFLSLVFGVAGVTKLLDPKGTRESLTSFGVSEPFAPAASILLPVAELAVCLGLLFGTTARLASCVALLMLCVFSGVVAVNIYRGNTPECHCFGQLYSRPLGRGTLLRNGIFVFLAGLVAFRGAGEAGPNVWTFLAKLFTNQPQLAIAGSLVAAIAIGIGWSYLRKNKSAANQPPSTGLPVESVAPDFELTGFNNANGSLKNLLAYDKPVMLLFANPKCGPCAAIFEEVGHWQQHHSTSITIAVISQGTMKDNFVNTARNNLRNVLLQNEREIADLYEAKLTPSAVIVRPNGVIGSKVVAGADEIRSLLNSTIGSTDHSHSHPVSTG
jgi:uncharacterized membrane protein YphA (DoxX/SURF4 family)/thiol-disulfide isomerase/thioredoxin